MEDKPSEKKKKTPEEIVAEHERLLHYDGPDRIVSAAEVWKRATVKGPPGILAKSGIDIFDNALGGGFFAGQVVVVSGFSGEGKTTFCRTLTDSFAKQGVNPLWFSYEEVEEEFLEKFPKSILPFFYMPNELTDKNVQWIHERIKEGKIKYDCHAVFVDHLHYLVDLYKMKNPSLEIGAVMRSIKKVALINRVAFFLIAHMAKVDRSKEVEAGSTRDSSFVEQESDAVMYVWRDKNKEDDTSIVKITKNRKRGKVNIKAVLHFNEALGIYDYGKEG